jgi:hypothetical protein
MWCWRAITFQYATYRPMVQALLYAYSGSFSNRDNQWDVVSNFVIKKYLTIDQECKLMFYNQIIISINVDISFCLESPIPQFLLCSCIKISNVVLVKHLLVLYKTFLSPYLLIYPGWRLKVVSCYNYWTCFLWVRKCLRNFIFQEQKLNVYSDWTLYCWRMSIASLLYLSLSAFICVIQSNMQIKPVFL